MNDAPMWEAYCDDLAYIHDVGFGGFASKSARGLLSILQKARISRGLVVDLGCGSGIWARELAGAGYDVLGVDISPAMIRLARKKAPTARFQRKSYFDLTVPKCRAVTSIGECLSYCFDRQNTKRQLAQLFAHVYGALSSGGVFVFDVAVPGRGRGPRLRHWSAKEWAILAEVEEDSARRRLTRRITTFRKVGNLYRRREELHQLKVYEPGKLVAELRGLGFRVRTVRGYGQFRFPPGLVGFIARKP